MGEFKIKFPTVRHLCDVVPRPQIPLLLSSCYFHVKGCSATNRAAVQWSNVFGFSSWQNLMSLTLEAAGWESCLSRGAVASLTSDHTDCWLEPACESIHPRNAPACTGFSLLLTCEKNSWIVSALTKWVTQKC